MSATGLKLSIPRSRHVLPGFRLSLGLTLFYLTSIVLIPLLALVIRPIELGFDGFWASISTPRVLAALRLSFGMALVAAVIDSVFGFIIAWVLVRYRFPGKALLDAVIDLPFALPTAVAGIALSTLYAPNGWIGSILAEYGIRIAYTPWGVLVAMTFIGLPFTVRTLQPVLSELGLEIEEAAATLGATRLQTIARVVLPMLMPAILTGAAMAFARGVGEYGSIIFIAGNIPAVSEIAPLLIVTKLEQYDYAGAAAIGVVMLAASFVMLLALNGLQSWAAKRR
ncbi:MAG TPA: sulfate ABC transporter permease subunit CysT [Rhizomicrobium sp.]|nr:sulfate ABC transporter permease subunit CysT [Rhizomicrobium sp.]HKY18107.1 sulfate ABC transporter permease subunit CysT [Rhizomicrobium sp.]